MSQSDATSQTSGPSAGPDTGARDGALDLAALNDVDVRRVRKRSVSIRGHRTSVALEDGFWREVDRLVANEGLSLQAFLARVDEARPPDLNLASALRLTVLLALSRKPEPSRSDAAPSAGHDGRHTG